MKLTKTGNTVMTCGVNICYDSDSVTDDTNII